MRAAVFEGPRRLTVRDVPDPSPARDEIIAKVQAVGICGSELEAFVGSSSSRRGPLIFGHEAAVTVPADDSNQLYVVNPLRSCGACELCRAGDTNLCANRSLMSLHRDGAYAEMVAVRRSELFPIAEAVAALTAAIVEPAATAAHALDVPGGVAGQRVVIIGCGSLGLLAVQLALASGAGEVVACDVVPARRNLAAGFGARAVSEIGPSEQGSVVIDMVGSHATRKLAVESCRPGGHVRLVGLLAQESLIPASLLISRGIHLQGVYAYRTSHILTVIEQIENGAINVEPMVMVGSLQEVPSYFEVLASEPGRWVKVVMVP